MGPSKAETRVEMGPGQGQGRPQTQMNRTSEGPTDIVGTSHLQAVSQPQANDEDTKGQANVTDASCVDTLQEPQLSRSPDEYSPFNTGQQDKIKSPAGNILA